ncbi:MAG: hypothetical protein NTY35_03160 [Planctomycetota bacterium]|nr:hypothetical protein [Planctomycetota bacterium]
MFDIESSIQGWRGALLAREMVRVEDADELEDHLRAEIEDLSALQRGGVTALSPEEVFGIAARRLGRTDALAAEFAKSDPGAVWRRRWIWMLGGYLGIGFAVSLITTVATVAYGYSRGQDSTWGVVLYSSILLFGLIAVVGLARWSSRSSAPARLQDGLVRRLRTTAGIAGLTLVAIALKAAIVPVAPMLLLRMDGVRTFEPVASMWYAQASLWLAPFVALALLIWFERGRLDRGESRPT